MYESVELTKDNMVLINGKPTLYAQECKPIVDAIESFFKKRRNIKKVANLRYFPGLVFKISKYNGSLTLEYTESYPFFKRVRKIKMSTTETETRAFMKRLKLIQIEMEM